jgi:CheY-like chemotaxis protein
MVTRAAGETAHVLVVENDPVLRDAITTELQSAGIGVRAASNGVAALTFARLWWRPGLTLCPRRRDASVLQF